MTQTITTHKINGTNNNLKIETFDTPAGNNHHYRISTEIGNKVDTNITFQHGTTDTNGITNETLLAIIIHRLQSFQKGPHACRENALALTKTEEALHWLQARTRARTERGVENTTQP